MILAPVTGGYFDCHVLYLLLEERTPDQSISHKRMPSWDDHCAFVRSKPYPHWYLIRDRGDVMGSVYLSQRREIGVFVFKAYQGQGYGKAAVKELLRSHPGELFLANINPANEASIRFFESLGFTPLQVTYAIDRR